MNIKRALMIVSVSVLTLGISGCAGKAENYWDSGGKTQLAARAAEDTDTIDKLYDIGLINEESRDSMKQSIVSNQKKIEEAIDGGAQDLNDIGGYITWYKTKEEIEAEHPKEPYVKAGKSYLYDLPTLRNYYNQVASKLSSYCNPDSETGLALVSTECEEELEKLIGYKIYVLKSSNGVKYSNDKGKKGGQTVSTNSMQELSDAVYILKQSQAKGASSKDADTEQVKAAMSLISGYFTDSGETLIDVSNKNAIVKETLSISTGASSSSMGYDLVLTSDTEGTVHLRLQDFNPNTINKILGASEIMKDKYLVVGNKIYLMEYPVSVIEEMSVEEDSNGKKKFNTTVTKGYSGKMNTNSRRLYLNIMNGTVVTEEGTVMSQESDPMYSVSSRDGASCSFMLDGTTTYFDIGAKTSSDMGIEEGCTRIVLTDYLELIPMRDLIPNEDMVALGRRIRVKKLSGKEETVFAQFIDKKGNVITDSPNIYASDICGTKSFGEGYDDTLEKLKLGVISSGSGVVNDSDDEEETGRASDAKYKQYKAKYVSKMKVKYMFPPLDATSGSVDIADAGTAGKNNTKVQMYGLATDLNIFSTALYSGWINVEGNGGNVGSLDWWIDWLKKNEFSYALDKNEILSYIGENYSYEIDDSGELILDLDTIAKIQEDYNEEDKIETVTNIRTASMVLGMIMIAYSVLLVLAWIVDTSIVNGPKTLELLSFGHWTAVSNEDEMPSVNSEEHQYLGVGSVVKKAIIICCVALILFRVDVIEIVKWIVDTFGGFVETIKQIMFNE